MSTYYMPGIVLCTSFTESSQQPYHILLVPILHVRTQVQRSDVICPRSHGKSKMKLGTQICLSPKPRAGLVQQVLHKR